MALKLQTIGESKRYLLSELSAVYQPREAGAVASLLIESVTGMNLSGQLRNEKQTLSDYQSGEILRGCDELKQHRPVQYVTGYAWFLGRRFRVGSGVLIPRQETEELVMHAIGKAGRSFRGRILEFCTGSGCMAVTLSAMLPGAKIWATELYDDAFAMAARNIEEQHSGVTLLRHDLLGPDFGMLPKADMLLANPPYVLTSEKSLMSPLVLNYEPAEALFVPDDDPLLYYRPLLRAVELLLEPGGWFCFEINEKLGGTVASLFTVPFTEEIRILNDIHSRNRFIAGTRAG